MPEEGFTAVTLPVALVDAVRKGIAKHPELGYTSLAEFVKDAIRDRLDLVEGRATWITGIRVIDSILRGHPELGPVLRVPAPGARTAIFVEGDRVRFVDLRQPEGVELAAKEYEKYLRTLAARGEIQDDAIEPLVAEYVRHAGGNAARETRPPSPRPSTRGSPARLKKREKA